jgi:hypothetical protein
MATPGEKGGVVMILVDKYFFAGKKKQFKNCEVQKLANMWATTSSSTADSRLRLGWTQTAQEQR